MYDQWSPPVCRKDYQTSVNAKGDECKELELLHTVVQVGVTKPIHKHRIPSTGRVDDRRLYHVEYFGHENGLLTVILGNWTLVRVELDFRC